MRTYIERRTKFFLLEKVELKDFNINHYQRLKTYIGSLNIKVKTKNHYHKFLKELINYETK